MTIAKSKQESKDEHGGVDKVDENDDRLHLPTPREAALLVLHLLNAQRNEKSREVTRARLTEITIRHLWGRTRISDDLILAVQEYLLRAGWAFFWSGSSYAIIKVSSVEGWPRISSKRIAKDLGMASRGRFNFNALEPLLLPVDESPDDEEEDKSE